MTYWDNADMLVDYIRHTFITTDESGLSESILPPPSSLSPFTVSSEGVVLARSPDTDASDDAGCFPEGTSDLDRHSPDICMDYGYRKRTNTAKRLDDLRSKRGAESTKVKTVHWSAIAGRNAGEEGGGPVDTLAFLPEPQPPGSQPLGGQPGNKGRSLIAKLIEDDQPSSANQFQSYAKFDATVNFVPSSKRIKIWLHLANQSATTGRYPLPVCVDAGGRVRDLIGLVAFLYTAEGRKPEMNSDLSHYSLFMAEEDGEIDDDLPKLDSAELVGKFGFPHLALVEQRPNPIELAMAEILDGPPKNQISLHFDGGRETTAMLEDIGSATVADLKAVALQKRKELLCHSLQNSSSTIVYDYNIERLDEPGKALALDALVRTLGTKQFYVVRDNARRSTLVSGPISRAHTETMDSVTSSGSDYGNPFCSPLSPGLLESSLSNEDSPFAVTTPSFNSANQTSPYADLGSCYFYSAVLSHKLLFPKGTEVQLVICLDRIEIIPPSRKLSATDKIFNSMQRQSLHSAIVHPIDRVGGVEVVEASAKGKNTFRIVYKSDKPTGEQWKTHHFEVSELAIAEEIVKRLSKILDRAPSANRKDYLSRTPGRRPKSMLMRRLHSLDFSSSNTPK